MEGVGEGVTQLWHTKTAGGILEAELSNVSTVVVSSIQCDRTEN